MTNKILAIVLGLTVGLLYGPANWEPEPVRPAPPCNWAPGQPCGCNPLHGPCVMPCQGCCPDGCFEPPPTAGR